MVLELEKMGKEILRKYPACFATNDQKIRTIEPLGTRIPDHPLELVSIDNFHYPKSNMGNKQLTIVVDNFSRVCHMQTCKTGTGAEIAKAVEEFIFKFGAPKSLTSDHFSGNIAGEMKSLMKTYGFDIKLGGVTDSRQNGLVENLGKHVLYSTLKNNFEETSMEDWDKNIQKICYEYNTTPRLCLSEKHMISPFDIIFRHSHQSPLSALAKLKEAVKKDNKGEDKYKIYDQVRESRDKYLAIIAKKYQPFLGKSEHELNDIVFLRRTSF